MAAYMDKTNANNSATYPTFAITVPQLTNQQINKSANQQISKQSGISDLKKTRGQVISE